MILLERSRFAYSPESKSFTKQRGSFDYFVSVFWFSVFTRRPIPNCNVAFCPRKHVFYSSYTTRLLLNALSYVVLLTKVQLIKFLLSTIIIC